MVYNSNNSGGLDSDMTPIGGVDLRMGADLHHPLMMPPQPAQNLKRTPFRELEPIDQYMIAKSVHLYLERMSSVELACFLPVDFQVEEEHRGAWVEFYLCQAIVRAAMAFSGPILEKARADAIKLVEEHAKMASESAKNLHEQVEKDREYRAALAMRSLERQVQSVVLRPKGGHLKP